MTKKIFFIFAMCVLTLGVILLLAEGLVRWRHAAPEVVYIEKWRMRLAANPKIGWEAIPNFNADGKSYQFYGYPGTSNSMGFRDHEHAVKKPAGVYRVLVLGDSVTAGLWISEDKDTYPAMLEAKLAELGKKVEVLNFGVMGYNTQQEVETLREKGLKFSPDLVVLGYCLNDRTRDDGNILGFLLSEGERPNVVNRAQHPSWVYQSSLFRFLRFRIFPAVYKKPPPPQVTPEAFEKDTVEDSFAGLAQLSKENNFRVLVLMFPDFTTIESMQGEYQFQDEHDKIRALAERQGFLFLDLKPSFIECKKKDPGALVAFDRFHLRPYGCQHVADTISEFLFKNGLLPK